MINNIYNQFGTKLSVNYGTKEWFESQYGQSRDDPWGLDWRPSQRFRYWVMLEALRETLPPSVTPSRILDIGCATGLFTALLTRIAGDGTARVTGIDLSETAVSRARRYYPDIEFLAMPLDECASKFRESADLVTCLEVLYYLAPDQRREALQNLKGMLRPDGMVLVSSMIASQPYFSARELQDLIHSEFEVIHTGVLYLKPLVLAEKTFMRLQALTGRLRAKTRSNSEHRNLTNPQTVHRIARLSQLFLGSYAQSHAYVLARRPRGV